MALSPRTRREFLAEVGRGMLAAGVGTAMAADLGIGPVLADESPQPLSFGAIEPLVALMQETPLDRLMSTLVRHIGTGTELRELVTAAALANARTFGGQDYIGYHTLMAMMPAYAMSRQLPTERSPLPVLKVLYRNTSQIQTLGGRENEVLHPVEPAPQKGTVADGTLRNTVLKGDMQSAEQTFAALTEQDTHHAYDELQHIVQDEINVHRVVLAWRAWDVLNLTGMEFAHTMLRQSVRFCVSDEQRMQQRGYPVSAIRTVLPRLLDHYLLLGKSPGQRTADDAWIRNLSLTVYGGTREHAAEAVAEALADGFSPEVVGEAISLAANQLVLHDPGRQKYTTAEKPAGSVHGDSIGVHASDAANAWRHIARVTNDRNTFASLIVGAYHTAGQSGSFNAEPYPFAEQLESITTNDPGQLLQQVEQAIEQKDQALACALVARYGSGGNSPQAVFDLLLKYALSEDGALHAEKYFRTVYEEFHASRPAFRWGHLVALTRVTTSEYGYAAPGYAEASRLLLG